MAVVTIGLAGCRPDRAIRSGALIGKGTKEAESVRIPEGTGAVSGYVRLRGSVPAPVKIDMTSDVVCAYAARPNLSEQYVTRNGGLGNVYVYLKDGPVEAMRAEAGTQQPVPFEESGCRYEPHVAAVMQGGAVEFRNVDGTRHEVRTLPARNAALTLMQPAKGAPVRRSFAQAEAMIPVHSSSHPWMSGYLNVSATPFFAVSGEDGRFEIAGLPPGEYVLAAVHERLGEQTIRLTIASKKQTPAEFTYTAK
jgi:hypothetical protein